MEEIKDSTLWSSIVLGAVVGFASMFVIAVAIVVVGGQSIGIAVAIGLWIGFVIGPYVGGFAVLSGRSVIAERHERQVPTPDAEEDVLRPAA
jgi:hypothetical protein